MAIPTAVVECIKHFRMNGIVTIGDLIGVFLVKVVFALLPGVGFFYAFGNFWESIIVPILDIRIKGRKL